MDKYLQEIYGIFGTEKLNDDLHTDLTKLIDGFIDREKLSIDKEKLLLELSRDYTENLKDFASNLASREKIGFDSEDEPDLMDLLLEFNPDGDEENTAREAGYIKGLMSAIATIRNFNSLNK